jgi:hypothetical protein
VDRRRVVQAGFVAVAIVVALQARRPTLGVAPAAACSCANDSPPSVQPYGRDVARPRNARLRLTPIWHLPDKPIYDAWAKKNGFDGASWKLELRKKGGEIVETEQRVVGEAELRTLEIWPKAPLEPRATYTLDPKGFAGKEKDHWRTHGEITTTDAPDTAPPAWSGAAVASYLPTGLPNNLGPGSCSVSTPVVEIHAPAKDDATATDDLVLGVWRVAAPDATPVAIVPLHDGKAYLGNTSYCSEDDFHVSKTKDKLVLRVIDLAGNASDPREVTVDPSLPPPPAAPVADDGAPRSGCSRACGKH